MADLRSEYNSCLYHAGAALARSLHCLAVAHFHPVGITPTMGFILLTARVAPGVSITDLGAVHLLDSSTISRAVDKLAADRYIVRANEAKVVQVFLTPDGERKAAEAESAWQKLQLEYRLLLGEGEARWLAEKTAKADEVLRKYR